MTDYAQLNEDGSFFRQIKTTGNVEWDATHFCPPGALTAEEAALFRVVPFDDIPKPEHNRLTHAAVRDGGEMVNGQWQTKWVIEALPAETVAVNQAEAVAALQASIVQATQARLDAFAQTRGYDSILSACTYASSGVLKFATEGQYAVDVRDSTWATLYTLMAQVQAGTAAVPTGFADVEPLLPVLEWPA